MPGVRVKSAVVTQRFLFSDLLVELKGLRVPGIRAVPRCESRGVGNTYVCCAGIRALCESPFSLSRRVFFSALRVLACMARLREGLRRFDGKGGQVGEVEWCMESERHAQAGSADMG